MTRRRGHQLKNSAKSANPPAHLGAYPAGAPTSTGPAGQPGRKVKDVDLRPFMAGFPTGVGIITTLSCDGAPRGMTCTSMCSVTLDPPTVLVCLHRDSSTFDGVVESKRFALHLLHTGARQAAEIFASGERGRFDRLPWHLPDGAGGPHLAGAAHAVADCRLAHIEPVGSHCVVFGHVLRISHYAEPRPLLYGLRRFAEWPDAPASVPDQTSDSTSPGEGASTRVPYQDHKGTYTP